MSAIGRVTMHHESTAFTNMAPQKYSSEAEETEVINDIYKRVAVDGFKLSPIDFTIQNSTPISLPKIKWINYYNIADNIKVTNSGFTAIVSGKWDKNHPYVCSGPLKGNYLFSQIHFHWGEHDETGSEHAVDGVRYPLEMHVVHYKDQYLNQEEALKKEDGVAIMVHLFAIHKERNPYLDQLTAVMQFIQAAYTTAKLGQIPLAELVRPFDVNYFLYWGAVSSAIGLHRILWFVSRQILPVSSSQLAEFRTLCNFYGKPLKKNSSNPYPLIDRALFVVSPSEQPNDTVHGVSRLPGEVSHRSQALPSLDIHEAEYRSLTGFRCQENPLIKPVAVAKQDVKTKAPDFSVKHDEIRLHQNIKIYSLEDCPCRKRVCSSVVEPKYKRDKVILAAESVEQSCVHFNKDDTAEESTETIRSGVRKLKALRLEFPSDSIKSSTSSYDIRQAKDKHTNHLKLGKSQSVVNVKRKLYVYESDLSVEEGCLNLRTASRPRTGEVTKPSSDWEKPDNEHATLNTIRRCEVAKKEKTAVGESNQVWCEETHQKSGLESANVESKATDTRKVQKVDNTGEKIRFEDAKQSDETIVDTKMTRRIHSVGQKTYGDSKLDNTNEQTTKLNNINETKTWENDNIVIEQNVKHSKPKTCHVESEQNVVESVNYKDTNEQFRINHRYIKVAQEATPLRVKYEVNEPLKWKTIKMCYKKPIIYKTTLRKLHICHTVYEPLAAPKLTQVLKMPISSPKAVPLWKTVPLSCINKESASLRALLEKKEKNRPANPTVNTDNETEGHALVPDKISQEVRTAAKVSSNVRRSNSEVSLAKPISIILKQKPGSNRELEPTAEFSSRNKSELQLGTNTTTKISGNKYYITSIKPKVKSAEEGIVEESEAYTVCLPVGYRNRSNGRGSESSVCETERSGSEMTLYKPDIVEQITDEKSESDITCFQDITAVLHDKTGKQHILAVLPNKSSHLHQVKEPLTNEKFEKTVPQIPSKSISEYSKTLKDQNKVYEKDFTKKENNYEGNMAVTGAININNQKKYKVNNSEKLKTELLFTRSLTSSESYESPTYDEESSFEDSTDDKSYRKMKNQSSDSIVELHLNECNMKSTSNSLLSTASIKKNAKKMYENNFDRKSMDKGEELQENDTNLQAISKIEDKSEDRYVGSDDLIDCGTQAQLAKQIEIPTYEVYYKHITEPEVERSGMVLIENGTTRITKLKQSKSEIIETKFGKVIKHHELPVTKDSNDEITKSYLFIKNRAPKDRLIILEKLSAGSESFSRIEATCLTNKSDKRCRIFRKLELTSNVSFGNTNTLVSSRSSRHKNKETKANDSTEGKTNSHKSEEQNRTKIKSDVFYVEQDERLASVMFSKLKDAVKLSKTKDKTSIVSMKRSTGEDSVVIHVRQEKIPAHHIQPSITVDYTKRKSMTVADLDMQKVCICELTPTTSEIMFKQCIIPKKSEHVQTALNKRADTSTFVVPSTTVTTEVPPISKTEVVWQNKSINESTASESVTTDHGDLTGSETDSTGNYIGVPCCSQRLSTSVSLAWPKEKAEMYCGYQSPIRIHPSRLSVREFPKLQFCGHWTCKGQAVIENTGRTVRMCLDYDTPVSIPYLKGGPLYGMYVFEELHFRWGSSDCSGAEHVFDKEYRCLEAQFVHYNQAYGSLNGALNYPDGIACLSVTFKTGGQLDEDFQVVVDALKQVTVARTSAKVHASGMFKWLRKHMDTSHSYITYPGSLTTCPFCESVVWIVIADPFVLCCQQSVQFRRMLDMDEQPYKNFRKTQSRNNRPIYTVPL